MCSRVTHAGGGSVLPNVKLVGHAPRASSASVVPMADLDDPALVEVKAAEIEARPPAYGVMLR